MSSEATERATVERATHCVVCAMTIFPGPLASERREHARLHDIALHGHRKQAWAGETAFEHEGLRVVVVAPDAPMNQRSRVEDLVRKASWTHDGAYDGGLYHARDKDWMARAKPHAFLAVQDGRVVALAVLVRLAESRKFHIDGGGAQGPDAGPRWGVYYIWVPHRHRDTGLVYRLLDALAAWANCAVGDIAWQPEFSEDAERLIRRLSPDGLYYSGPAC